MTVDKRAAAALKRLAPALGARTLDAARALKDVTARIEAMEREDQAIRDSVTAAAASLDPQDLDGFQAHHRYAAAARRRLADRAGARTQAEVEREKARDALARAFGEERAVDTLLKR